MAYVEWNEKKLATGIESIDSQHKILIKIINDLFVFFNDPNEKLAAKRTIVKLLVYVEEHFKYEETLFSQHCWPGKNDHINAHVLLTKKVLGIQQQLDQEHDKEDSLKLMSLLKDWISEHILIEDKKYIEYLIEKGVK